MTFTTQYAESQPKRAEVDALQGATLLEFGNSWCGHCRAAQPLIASALRDYPNVRHLRFADASRRRLGRTFRVKLWPTLIFLRDGKEIVRVVRPRDETAIRTAAAQIHQPAATGGTAG